MYSHNFMLDTTEDHNFHNNIMSVHHVQEPRKLITMFSTCYPKPHNPVHTLPFCFFNTHFNTVNPSTPGCSKLSPSFSLPKPDRHYSSHPLVADGLDALPLQTTNKWLSCFRIGGEGLTPTHPP